MALPTIAVPKYTMTIPSSKKKVSYRPFLVKEQKILLMALESGEEKQMLDAMYEIIKACVEGVDDPLSMPMFDIEYMFAMIRSKSVGESVDVTAKCIHCDKPNDIVIPIDTIEVKFPESVSSKVMITDTMGVQLKYPSLKDAALPLKEMGVDELLDYLIQSMDYIFDADQVYPAKEHTKEELLQFLESLNSDQFTRIVKFYENLPYLNKEIEHTCVFCKEKFPISFKGLKDFFT
jgi:hypothetical protein